ncbi:MAG: S8 family serine peptidase [bacterium]|nr:MAG: S8 family serine peptidase [bacterium]
MSKRLLPVPSLIVAILLVTGCSDDGTGPEPETLSRFSVSTPVWVRDGKPFQITIQAVGNYGTSPFEEFNGNVGLSVTSGDITPATLTLSDGIGSSDVTISQAAGRVGITASATNKSGTTFFTVLLDSITGNPSDLVCDRIPDVPYVADPRNFSNDHPSLPGMHISYNTAAVVFETGTTVAQANAIISSLGAGIAAGITGQAGVYQGLLTLQLPSASHTDMETDLATLRADPQVQYAVQDVMLGADCIPGSNGGNPADWTWQVDPAGANWNLERVRAPQLWNLNDAIRRTGQRTPTLILDTGFHVFHEDVNYHNLTPAIIASGHGTEVAGVLGADYDNGRGIDGINPFADMKAKAVSLSNPSLSPATSVYDTLASVLQSVVDDLLSQLVLHPDARVVNMSLGYGWHHHQINAKLDVNAQTIANTHGAILAQALDYLGTTRSLPLIAVSSGNDSYAHPGFGEQLAEFGSPMTNAAIDHGVDCILVVEALSYEPLLSDRVTTWVKSNMGGHLSAPGGDVMVTSGGSISYQSASGTSFAAPHVAGLAGYLLALDPGLTTTDLRILLLSNTVPVAGGAPRIDAWACALDIDRIRNDRKIVTLLCDIDDQTPDGNQRIDYEDGSQYGQPDGADGYRGDGDIDMSDFRRWRDWLHQVEGPTGLALDGVADHPKRDVNGDNTVGTAAEENVYPLGDFNGDGIMSRTARNLVPGYLNYEATDLEVLQALFVDPNYSSGDLPGLLNSADITLDLGTVIPLMEGTSARVYIQDAATYSVIENRQCPLSDPVQIFTVPASDNGYVVSVNVVGNDFNFSNRLFESKLCGDDYARPIMFHKLDPRQTFLRTCSDHPWDPSVFSLDSLDIESGDRLLFEIVGDFSCGDGCGPWRHALGVFSSSDEVLSSDERYRIPGAINAGDDYDWVTLHTYYCDLPTDITQDFTIEEGLIVVTVPSGATHIVLGTFDVHYEDNFDQNNDFGVNIYVLKKE